MAKYLDYDGLLYFWQKIKSKFINGVSVNSSPLTPDINGSVNVTVTQGTANGSISVNGSDVSVKGLGSAAYTNSTAYDASGSASAVLGTSSDSATANTVYGAKAAASAAQSDVDALETLVGSTAVSTQISNAIDGLDSSISSETNKAIASVTITNGKITANTKVTIPTNNNQLTNGAGYQTSSQVQSAINTALADITGISFEIVQTLPASGENGTIYLIKNAVDSIVVDNFSATKAYNLSHPWDKLTLGDSYNVVGSVETQMSGQSTYRASINTTITLTNTAIPLTYTGGASYLTGIIIDNTSNQSFRVNFDTTSTHNGNININIYDTTNSYDEYIWIDNAWEKIGTTDIDLSDYWNTSNLVEITNGEIDTIVAS